MDRFIRSEKVCCCPKFQNFSKLRRSIQNLFCIKTSDLKNIKFLRKIFIKINFKVGTFWILTAKNRSWTISEKRKSDFWDVRKLTVKFPTLDFQFYICIWAFNFDFAPQFWQVPIMIIICRHFIQNSSRNPRSVGRTVRWRTNSLNGKCLDSFHGWYILYLVNKSDQNKKGILIRWNNGNEPLPSW